jgi:hypothetical protein
LDRTATLRAKPRCLFRAEAAARGNLNFQVVVRACFTVYGNRHRKRGRREGNPALGNDSLQAIFSGHRSSFELVAVQTAQDIGALLEQEEALGRIIFLRNLAQIVIEVQLLNRAEDALAFRQ